MRHKILHKNFGRDHDHRKALFRNLLTQLVKHERIVTTVVKAKQLRKNAEKLITTAKRGTLAARRRANDVLYEKFCVKKLFDQIVPRFRFRPGGFTRIVPLGRRLGDQAPMALIEYIDQGLKYPAEWKKPIHAPKNTARMQRRRAEREEEKLERLQQEAEEDEDKIIMAPEPESWSKLVEQAKLAKLRAAEEASVVPGSVSEVASAPTKGASASSKPAAANKTAKPATGAAKGGRKK